MFLIWVERALQLWNQDTGAILVGLTLIDSPSVLAQYFY